MSKLDVNVINTIKMLSIDMIKEAGSGDSGISLSFANVFYNLFLNHLNFQSKNPHWINRDRIILNNRYLPIYYSTLHMFGYDISLDNLKEYKKLNSVTQGFPDSKNIGIEIGSITNGDVISSSVGISIGERYINSLIKSKNEKCNLINFHTYCFCTMDDLMSGLGYESLSFLAKEKLNKLIIICNDDGIGRDSSTKETYPENLIDKFISLNFNYIEVKNGHNSSAINDAIEEAKESKRPSIIMISTKYAKDSIRENTNDFFNVPLEDDDINNLSTKYKINLPILDTSEYQLELSKIVNKRLEKYISNWNKLNDQCKKIDNINEIIEFLENKNIKLDFSSNNFKLGDNYNEELLIGNSKMFNIFSSKSPFVLSLSNDNFIYTKCNINKSDIMSKDNKLGRNILCGTRTNAMGGIANGLSSLGFKVFVSAPLIDSNILLNQIRFSSMFNYRTNYIFINDSVTNSYENIGINSYNEINILRLIPNLLVFRPCDINEIIGVYEILANYNNPSVLIIGNEKIPKLDGTNPKFVVAGAYRIKRERGEATGTLIATGSEVKLALEISEELLPYGIDLRVVSMPSKELFERQNDRYKFSLIPKELKTFVIEFGETKLWNNYVLDNDYVFGLKNYSNGGTKYELLNYNGLTKDNIKAKIIELLKN